MNEASRLVMASVAGLVFGVIFFGGLWWTVRKGVASPRPALWFLGSMLVRMSIVLGGFYWVGGGQWQLMAACLIGFAMARFLVQWLTLPPVENNNSPAKEAGHAP